MFGSPLSLHDYLQVLRQHHFKIVLAFLLTFGSALVVSFYLPPSYQASCLVEVQPSQRATPISTNLFQTVFSGNLNRGELENLVRRFSTQSLLQEVVDELEMGGNPGAQYLPPIGKLRRSVQARVVPDTSYIQVSVQLAESEGGERNAALLANALVRKLQEWRDLDEKQRTLTRQEILDSHLQDLQRQLETSQSELMHYMAQQGSPATWYPILTHLLDRRKELSLSIHQIQSNLDGSREEEKLIEARLAEQPEFIKTSETLATDPLWLNLQTELTKVEGEIAEAAARYGEESPQWKGLQQKRDALRRQLKHRVQRTVTSMTQATSALYVGLLERQWDVEGSILRAEKRLERLKAEERQVEQELDALLADLPGWQYRFDRIRRTIDELSTLLLDLQKRRVEAEILLAESSQPERTQPYPVRGGMAVIDPAVPRKIPVRPNRRFILTLAGMVGLGLGVLWAILSEWIVRTSENPHERSSQTVPKNS